MKKELVRMRNIGQLCKMVCISLIFSFQFSFSNVAHCQATASLSADTIAACDYTVRIPMSHGVDSLNVAAASAVAFWATRVR